MAQTPENPPNAAENAVLVADHTSRKQNEIDSPLLRLKRLAWQLGLLFLLYGLCRILFINVHRAVWQAAVSDFRVLWGGLRFDASAIAMTNALFIVLSLLPFAFVQRRGWQALLRGLFVGVNAIALLANLVDVAYFPFIHKRMQADALRFVTGEKGSDFYTLLPSFLLQYWYLVAVYAGLLWLLVKGYNRSLRFKTAFSGSRVRRYVSNTALFIVMAGMTLLAIRGGFQLIPVNVVNAGEVAGLQQAAAVLNTPFSILTTTERRELPERRYFEESELAFNGIHFPENGASFRKKNVVVILVESLSKRYVGTLGGSIPTPFLDSLLGQSLLFTNGFANAQESIQGIPAVLAGIPSWQDEPYIFSSYATNRMASLANMLTPYGYTTAFFHGGKNGTMGFDVFTKLAGYESYYGKTEYGNDADYDGHWGIWDEPFLQFTAQKLQTLPQPFTAAVFTLNTHHPFEIPEKYRKQFYEEGHPIRSCVRYADYALGQFFAAARTQPWYPNTLFVITADHASPRLEEGDYPLLNNHRIPIAFFAPDGSLSPRRDSAFANQIDILPTVLDYLHYPVPYFAFGKSLLEPAGAHATLSYIGGVYTFADSVYVYQFDGEKPLSIYNWTTDPYWQNNLASQLQGTPEYQRLDRETKSRIQLFNHTIRNNKMWVDTTAAVR